MARSEGLLTFMIKRLPIQFLLVIMVHPQKVKRQIKGPSSDCAKYLLSWPIGILISIAGVWADALAFGLSVAVGLSPQMMPMIVTANLSRASRLMRKQNAIVRRLDAVQNLGAM